jgi:predicted RNA polymerase sigma factor
MSRYHLQAGIAACHSLARNYDETDWARILTLYDLLIQIDPSPVVALNRAVAVSRIHGAETGLRSLEEIKNRSHIESYYLLHAIMGEFNLQLGNFEPALVQLRKALVLTSVHCEKKFLEKKIGLIEAKLAAHDVRLNLVRS